MIEYSCSKKSVVRDGIVAKTFVRRSVGFAPSSLAAQGMGVVQHNKAEQRSGMVTKCDGTAQHGSGKARHGGAGQWDGDTKYRAAW